jgi:rhodanese-related sulfurtransferase
MNGKIVRAIALLGLLATATLVSCRWLRWATVDAKIRHDFPQVRRITTAELAAWVHDEQRKAPLLLDVRTEPEFAVSHLRGALRVDPGSSVAALDLPKDEPIVTYCSVGYRSGEYAQKLNEAGYRNVVNLQGSIFKWANEGRPVYRGGRRVEKVHPFNKQWGAFLHEKLRADVPPAG